MSMMCWRFFISFFILLGLVLISGCFKKETPELKYKSPFCQGGKIGEVRAYKGNYSFLLCNEPRTDRIIVNYTADVEMGDERTQLIFHRAPAPLKPSECRLIKTKNRFLTARTLRVRYIEDVNPKEKPKTCLTTFYVD